MRIKGVLGVFSLYCLTFALARAGENQSSVRASWDDKFTNGIAAVVNKTVITVDELRAELGTNREFNEKLVFEVLHNLINRNLIVEDFEEQGYSIPKVRLEKEYDDYITNVFNGDRAAFIAWLRSRGDTPRKFREKLRNKMAVNYMRSRISKFQTAVSPTKIKQYYHNNKNVLFYKKEGVHLHQITLVPIANEAPELLVQQADKILADLHKGIPFSTLAMEYSQDDNAKKGGDYGWVERNELAPELAEIAFGLDEGKYSAPIVKDSYVFIFYVEAKRKDGVQPLSAVQGQIEEALAAEAARESRELWLERLRGDAYIKFYL